MNQYQKVYMNQIHSSSLLGQLAQMWRSQMLCDALIRTGNITTKAHRVVLVAACPMLQSMDNASVGSHLEVRLAADIKQEAVNSFLQYLYEGFMMLTEENCKDVEKVARLLQVDSVTKCCIDFYNCLQKKTGVNVYTNTQYKYSSADLLEFRHVRTTDLQKTIQERMMKRASSDSVRPASPGGKRQRTQQQRPLSPNIDLAMFGQKADDTLSMTNSYMGNIGNQAADPWERVPRIGAAHRPPQKPGVIEIVEDSLEILQTQPPDKDASKSAPPVVQKSLAISVSSQLGSSTDVHVVNVNDQSSRPTAASDGPIMSTGRDSITVSPLTVLPGSSISSSFSKDTNRHPSDNQKESPFIKKSQLEQQSSTPQRAPFPVSISPARMSPISQISQAKKSFAAGSATQAATMSQSQDSSSMSKRLSSVGNEMADRPPSSESGKEMGAKSKTNDGSANSADMAPDLSIIKVEPNIDDPGLDMYVDVPDDSMIQTHRRDQREHDDESDVELEEASGDWSQNEMSNEAAGSDQNNSWYIGQFKGAQSVDKFEDDHPKLECQLYSLTGSAYEIFYDLEQPEHFPPSEHVGQVVFPQNVTKLTKQNNKTSSLANTPKIAGLKPKKETASSLENIVTKLAKNKKQPKKSLNGGSNMYFTPGDKGIMKGVSAAHTLPKMSQKQIDKNKRRSSTAFTRKRLGLPLKLSDPDFWDIPLQAFYGYVEKPQDFAHKPVSQKYTCLPMFDPLSATIQESDVQKAFASCQSLYDRFAMLLFRSVISIGDIFNKNINGTLKKGKVNPIKIRLIREKTFQLFPAGSEKEEEVMWQHIVNQMHQNIFRAHHFVKKWFDISGIEEKLNQFNFLSNVSKN